MSEPCVVATYRVESAIDIRRAIEVIAGEQSCGTFVPTPGETPELKRRFGARIESILLEDSAPAPSLPGSKGRGAVQRATARISFPFVNFGANLPTLVSTLCGNLYELSEHSGLKLVDVELPSEFVSAFPGSQFGIAGTRRFAGVESGPILGTIIKPSVGLSPAETAAQVAELVAAGLDFVKDDELMANPPHSPFSERLAAVMRVVDEHADRTGKRVMVAFNISDEIDAMRRRHDEVLAAGGTCVMVSVNSVGLAGVLALRRHACLPIHGHRNGWGMLTRHPLLGIEFPAYQKFWRLAGVDQLHVNGLRNKFWEPDDSVLRSIQACFAPVGTDGSGVPIMPVVASGQWAGMAPDTYRLAGSADVMHLAGGGIMAHPDGPGAGVRSMRQAWDAAMAGIDLATYAETHPELRAAIARFGGIA